MTNDKILDGVLACIHEETGRDLSGKSNPKETPLVDVINDSVEFMNVLFFIEELFDIQSSDEEASNLKTIGDICDLVSKKQHAAAQ